MINLTDRAPRPDEERAGGFISLAIGADVRQVPVLTIAANRTWKATFEAAVRKVLGRVEDVDTLDAVVGVLNDSTDLMIDLLVAYDAGGQLGGRAWIEGHATDDDVYQAMKRVTAAAYPFGIDLARMIPDLRAILATAVMRASAARTSSPPPSTGGRRGRSSKS